MTTAVRPHLTHMGINVYDIKKMEEFYTRVLGLVVTDRGRGKNFKADLVFMSVDPHTHHQVALASGRDPDSPRSTINQISFHLDTLDELRVMYRRVKEHGVEGLKPLNHGVSWSVYFFDPEGNTVELYVDSPWYIAQPHGDPFDPELSTERITADTLEMCRHDEKFMPIEEFRASVQARLDAPEATA
ncbi:VOC family protein [Streptomyces sp. NBC_00582]|uniref:VOC family protein n=1 Tax=Streptomyces sp. NBC_00582 TaxID=2975783 RepID=UPI001062BFC9|nr:VOC family protein [Streptomyces sp. NBC_00582]WUB67265.1 VOC family protein [Streptomyces sp. NBC_00582]